LSNGRHLILDLYNCDQQLLDNYAGLQELIAPDLLPAIAPHPPKKTTKKKVIADDLERT
jgi:hypothetical protein